MIILTSLNNCLYSLILILVLFNLFGCLNEKDENKEKSIEESKVDTLRIPDPYIYCFCKSEETSDPFYCDNSIEEKYHVHILNLFRDMPSYSFSITMDSFTIKDISFRERAVGPFNDSTINKLFKFEQVCRYPKGYSDVVLRIFSNPRKEIELPKNVSDELYQFFHSEIWEYEKYDEEWAGEEYWYITGKKGSLIGIWRRRAFLDSSYYSKIQILLNQLDYSIYDQSGSLNERVKKIVGDDKFYEENILTDAVYIDSIFKMK